MSGFFRLLASVAPFSSKMAPWRQLSISSASASTVGCRGSTPTELALLENRTNKAPTNRSPRDVPPGPDRTKQAKKDLIGRLGEFGVYHWLKDRFRSQVIDKA